MQKIDNHKNCPKMCIFAESKRVTAMAERYTYMFDNKGRILMVALSDNLSAPGTYSRGYTYDLHGNILSVATPTDTTAVSYTGNQRSGNFTYDANGNMTADPEAGLTGMTYNVLNLLSGYNAANNRQVVLTYSASGEKLSEQVKVSGLIESEKKYFGNLVYEGLALYPNRLLIDGGYVDISTSNNSSSYTYRYYVQDHLGNNRLVTDDSGTILQTNHYDPYGQLLGDISSSTPVSQYKYANKEWDTTTASYDFGARRYTPSIPRWTAIDPLAEKYYSVSPYVYCAGNPVNLVDINGEKIRIWYTEEGVKKCFTYSGVETDIPQNEYVHSVIEAYQFNKANWESQGYTIECPGTIMVEDTIIEINVFSDCEFDSMYYRENGGRQSLIWNAYEGLETNNKIVLSPATLFVHEADHAMDDFRDAKAHSERVLKQKVDYTNEEEYRVINGSEQLSAIANGDIKAGGRTRNAHKGTLVYTISPTSNIIDKAATRYFYKHYTKKH